MDPSPVTITFPASPEYLRLARIATADAASRAGLDYEEIDDARIGVSELCGLLSVDATASIRLAFIVEPGVLSVTGEAVTGETAVDTSELSQAIIDAVVDEHTLDAEGDTTRFRITKRTRGHGAPGS
jgi:serine/threonine-protein kinase RsbW